MSKKSRCRPGHTNPTLERRRRQVRICNCPHCITEKFVRRYVKDLETLTDEQLDIKRPGWRK